MDTSRLVPWLALFHCLPLSSRHFQALLDVFPTPEAILENPVALFEKAGMNPAFCASLRGYQQSDNGDCEVRARIQLDFEWLQKDSNHILTINCPDYPPALRSIPDPPMVLYVSGNPSHLKGNLLAMVGSRKPTASGRRLARRFACQLSQAGIGIVSGLAFGIDSESHLGALMAESPTIAVLGGGLQHIYPRQHQGLAERIAGHGCVVSEFPLDFQPQAWCFPKRNRVITGLSKGVLVVEAALKSGSLVSAMAALEQGRDVYAIPGNIDSVQSAGCHRLIRQGAALVDCVQNVLDDWPELAAGPLKQAPDVGQPALFPGIRLEISSEQKRVLGALESDPIHLDQIVTNTALPASLLLSILTELEVQGFVARDDEGYARLSD